MIKVNIATYPVAFPSKNLCDDGGAHLYSLEHDTESWNGAVVAKGAYAGLDLYEEAEATTMDAEIVDIAPNGNFYVETLTLVADGTGSHDAGNGTAGANDKGDHRSDAHILTSAHVTFIAHAVRLVE